MGHIAERGALVRPSSPTAVTERAPGARLGVARTASTRCGIYSLHPVGSTARASSLILSLSGGRLWGRVSRNRPADAEALKRPLTGTYLLRVPTYPALADRLAGWLAALGREAEQVPTADRGTRPCTRLLCGAPFPARGACYDHRPPDGGFGSRCIAGPPFHVNTAVVKATVTERMGTIAE